MEMKEYLIGPHKVTKAQYDQWLVSSLVRQQELELLWNVQWRPGQTEASKTPEPQVADSVAATLAQRGSRYGDFTDHARLCQGLMDVMQSFNPGDPTCEDHPGSYPWAQLDNVKRQALTVIADKIARILSGDPNYDDNWHDIQGYAKLVEDRLPNKETPNV